MLGSMEKSEIAGGYQESAFQQHLRDFCSKCTSKSTRSRDCTSTAAACDMCRCAPSGLLGSKGVKERVTWYGMFNAADHQLQPLQTLWSNVTSHCHSVKFTAQHLTLGVIPQWGTYLLVRLTSLDIWEVDGVREQPGHPYFDDHKLLLATIVIA